MRSATWSMEQLCHSSCEKLQSYCAIEKQEEPMLLTYAEVMSRTDYLQRARILPYTGYNAILYAKWLPVAIITPLFAALSIALTLFFPWLSLGNTEIIKNPIMHNGFEIAGSVALAGERFSFPLWLLLVLSIILIAQSALLLR